jgi:putative phosphonate transport system ATP-binding protein
VVLQRRRRVPIARRGRGIGATVSAPAVVERGAPLPAPLLSVQRLGRRFGPGCPECLSATGDAAGTNRCPRCGTVVAVHGISFDVGPGEVLGIVGESGSGKTTLLRCIHLDLEPDDGAIVVDGEGDLLRSPRTQRSLQTETVVMVHQNALAAGLRLGFAAESNVAERLLATGRRSFADTHDRATVLLRDLEVQPARHRDPLATFSGGMQQRVQLARALVSPPPVLLLDEPTTGLDPSVQAGLLDTVQSVADVIGGATVMVSHDLGVMHVLATRVVVLHHGRVVEEGVTAQILEDPQHPYTRLLVSSRLP